MWFVSGVRNVSKSSFTQQYEYSGKHMSYGEFTALGDSSIGPKKPHIKLHFTFIWSLTFSAFNSTYLSLDIGMSFMAVTISDLFRMEET
jgi:hypothetical protein